MRALRALPPPKRPGLFAVQALLLTLAIGFWPTPRELYPGLFHAQANALFAALGAPELRLATPPPGSGVATDTLLERRAPGAAEPAWQSWFSLTRIGYWPSAALLALLLATPLRPGRRALAALAGLTLLDALTLARVGVEIAHADRALAQGMDGPLGLLLRIGSESLTATIPSVAFVFGCWVLVASPRRAIDLSGFRPERAA